MLYWNKITERGFFMLIYNLLLLLIIILGFFLCEWKNSRRNDLIFLLLVSAAMIVISSLRAHTVGIDYDMYANYYKQVHDGGLAFLTSSANMYRLEIGYSLLNYAVSLFTPDVRVFMAVVSVMVTAMVAVLAYKYSPIPWITMYIYASFGFFGNSLSFIRQSIAIAIFLFAVPFLMKRKFLPYVLIVLLAALFHKSILIMILAYFVAFIPINWKSLTAYAVGTGIVMGLSWPILTFVTKYIFKYYATTEGLYYVVVGRDWNTAFVPVLTAVVAVLLAKLLLRRNPANVVLINFSVFSALLFILTCQRFIFQRIGTMFFTTSILLIPELLKSVGVNSDQAEEYEQLKTNLKKQNATSKRKAYEESRKLKSSLNNHKYVYYYSAGTALFVGFLYSTFLLLANRINLIPYKFFF